MLFRFIVSCALTFCLTSVSYATTYYVDNQGRDKNSGTSQLKPWKTIDRVNKQDLNPGDQVLFHGGQTFTGSLYIPKSDSGTFINPVTFASYGTGAATIESGLNYGIFGYNVSGITISNLYFLGSSGNNDNGINFYTDSSTSPEGITISGVDVRQYGLNGINIGSWGTYAGYHHIHISSSQSRYNHDDGISMYAQYPYTHQDVYIGYVTSSYNSGIPGETKPSGHGISLGGVSNGTIEYSQAEGNGWLCDAGTGPTGVFVWDSTKVVVQNNTSHHNRTPTNADGNGFDFGQNVSYSTMQYNTSYENDGAGYLLDHGPSSGSNNNNIVQYNTSTNDSRKHYGSIQTWGSVYNATIMGNTVSLTPGLKTYIADITLANWGIVNNCIKNIIITGNNFIADSGPNLIIATSDILQCSTGINFYNNTYQGNPVSILWGSTTYNSLSAWTTSTGQN